MHKALKLVQCTTIAKLCSARMQGMCSSESFCDFPLSTGALARKLSKGCDKLQAWLWSGVSQILSGVARQQRVPQTTSTVPALQGNSPV